MVLGNDFEYRRGRSLFALGKNYFKKKKKKKETCNISIINGQMTRILLEIKQMQSVLSYFF